MNNRQFKFRCWSKKEGRFINDFFIDEDGFLSQDTGKYEFELNDLVENDYVIQQFTGLSDKNFKNIYEGDIICLKFGQESWMGEVTWEKYMGLKTNDGGWTSLVHVEKFGEILGNIFETPELLNKTK